MTAQNERDEPGSVLYARGLLRLQAGCWVFASGLCVLGVAENAAVGSLGGAAGFALAGAIAAMLAVLKVRLARRLLAGNAKVRKVAIGVEFAMTCFGALATLSLDPSGGITVGLIGLPLIVGTGLSLAAVIGLLCPPARRYLGPPISHSHDEPSNADGSDSASFWLPSAIALGTSGPYPVTPA
jgi:hypothetical protein